MEPGMTQTTVIEQIKTNCVEYKLENRKIPSSKNDNTYDNKTIVTNNISEDSNNFNQKLDFYDQVLPKNEWIHMSFIRKWEKRYGFVTPIRWNMLLIIALFHIFTIVGVAYCAYEGSFPKWQTWLFGIITGRMCGFGVTGGAHRLWCHRAYKAKWPLRIFLLLCYSVAGQNNVFQWVRDHRVHHKFSELTADPHNANRGFFFAHVGWLMMKKHPEVLREGRKIDMSDVLEDPLVRFHTKYFPVFKMLCCFIIPLVIPIVLWDEKVQVAAYAVAIRYMLTLHFTWSVNSFAHLWGTKPYDRTIMPVENKVVSVVAMGEGWHNYHHTFPWDYKAAELPYNHNLTTQIIDLFAKIGWAYDMKVASPALVKAVERNRGDHDHFKEHHH